MNMIDIALSVLLIASVAYLVYELRMFGRLHSRKYEVPTEKVWEKFVGMRPEEMAESNLTEKVQHMNNEMEGLRGELDKQKKLTKKLIEELGK